MAWTLPAPRTAFAIAYDAARGRVVLHGGIGLFMGPLKIPCLQPPWGQLAAVDLKTGQRKWHFQFVHHPVWNYDMSSMPILADINVNGRAIKAVAVHRND